MDKTLTSKLHTINIAKLKLNAIDTMHQGTLPQGISVLS